MGRKNKLRKRMIMVFLLCVMLGISGCGVVVVEEPAENTQGKANTAGNVQEEASKEVLCPQDDFYGYVNQEALLNYEITHFENGAGTFQEVDKVVRQEIAVMINDIVNPNKEYLTGSNEQIIRDVYLQTLEYLNGAESSAKKCFEAEAVRIHSAKTVAELKAIVAEIADNQGINLVFSPGVTKHIYRSGEYMVYLAAMEQVAGFALRDIYEKDDTRQELYDFAVNLLMVAGEGREASQNKAKAFVYDMIAVAENTDFEKLEAVNIFETAQVLSAEEINTGLTYSTIQELMELYGFQEVKEWAIFDAKQLKEVGGFFADEKLESLKTYMLCSLAYEYIDFLQREYAFLDTFQVAEKPEDTAIAYVSNRFAEQISGLYATAYYTEEMKVDLQKMYEDIVAGYRQLIQDADWLTNETREGMLQKLENMIFICGEKAQDIRPEDAEIIGEDAFATYINLRRRQNEENLNLLGTKVDRTEPGMASHAVNASYDPVNNSFTIAVAIMHAPFYSPEQSYVANMGGLGSVMCHEIGHAFDSNCLDFDADGVYNPGWICEEDRAELEKRLAKMEEYYSTFTVMDIYHVDGVKTSGENYADKGAMECLMTIVTDAGERKELFENYARIWCSLTEDTYAINLLQEDEHSPDRVRTNAVLSSTSEFYEVYAVKPGDGMYIPPEQRVSRWK